MGLVSDGGGSFFLPRLAGESRALEMLLTGETVSAADAKSAGILHRICPAEELEAQSLQLGRVLSAKPQTALRLLKQLIRQNARADLPNALENERKAQLNCFEDETHQEIVKEFLSRRNKENP